MFGKRKIMVFAVLIISLISTLIVSMHTDARGDGSSGSGLHAEGDLQSVKGKVKGFANPNQSKTISINVKGKGVMVFKYTDDTQFKNFKYLNELKGETAVVKYKSEGPDKIASVISKAYVKLPKGVAELTVKEVAEVVKAGPEVGNVVLIDARPVKRFNEGHIPSAVSIPFSKLKKEGVKLLPADKKTPVYFYCGGPTCGMSPKAAGLARKWGYQNVKVFVQGEPGWKKAGYYTSSTADYVKKANIVLIDLRQEEDVKAGHLPGAVGIPAAKFADARNMFPAYKGAHIVFYSENRSELSNAVKAAREWGYRKSTVFLGGVDLWKRKGYRVEKGPADEEISYVKKTAPGETSIADFESAMNTDTSVIVDVRTSTEHAAGHFKGAVNIPVDEMAVRCDELSKEKIILTHCITGVRAEMAYTILKDRGYNVKFLMAEPVFNDDGTYEIVE